MSDAIDDLVEWQLNGPPHAHVCMVCGNAWNGVAAVCCPDCWKGTP